MANAESTLRSTQLQTLALVQRRRREGLLPTAEEIDFVLDLIDQLITPGQTCCDRESLPCAMTTPISTAAHSSGVMCLNKLIFALLSTRPALFRYSCNSSAGRKRKHKNGTRR